MKIFKNQNKTSVAKDMGPSEIHRLLISYPGPESMYRLNPPLIGTVCINKADHALKNSRSLRVVVVVSIYSMYLQSRNFFANNTTDTSSTGKGLVSTQCSQDPCHQSVRKSISYTDVLSLTLPRIKVALCTNLGWFCCSFTNPLFPSLV